MKNQKLLSISLIIVFAIFISFTLSAKKKVAGSGNVVKQTRTAEAFTILKCQGIIDIYLSQGATEELIVECDDNLQAYIITTFKNGVLEIKNKDDIKFEKPYTMNIYLTVKDISEMHFNGVGDLKCQTELNLNSLKLSNNGVGDIHLKGKAKSFTAKNHGVGDIKAYDFIVEKADIKNSGVGDIEIYATDELKVVNNGVGDIKYKDGAKMVDIESNGVGSIRKK